MLCTTHGGTSLPVLLASILAGLVLSSAVPAQLPDRPTELKEGQIFESPIAGGQKLDFTLAPGERRLVRLEFDQIGADIVVRRIGSDGSVVAEYDNDPRNTGAEQVVLAVRDSAAVTVRAETRQRNSSGRLRVRVLEIREASEKDIAIDETRRLVAEANRYWRASDYAKALPPAELALRQREQLAGPDDFETSQTLIVLANIVGDQGDYVRAEALYLRAIAVREKTRGPDDITLSPALNNLGALYNSKAEYEKAEVLFRRALAVREKSLEPDHLLIASVLVNLGNVAKNRGNAEAAAQAYNRALSIREKALGSGSPEVAVILSNLGNLYPSDFARAESFYRRALEIRENSLGREHPEVGQNLYNLAVLYATFAMYEKALPLTERSVRILEKSLGAEHPFVSYPLNLLGVLRKNTGDLDGSESAYLRAVAIKEKTEGRFHPNLGGVLANLAGLYSLRGATGKAIEAQTRANEIFEYNTTINLAAGTEKEKIGYLRSLANSESRTISLHLNSAPDSQAAAELAAASILQRKGRVLDAMALNLAGFRRRLDPEGIALVDRLNGLNSRLVTRILEGPRSDPAAYESDVKSLEAERSRLETVINVKSAGFFERRDPVTLWAVRELIPVDVVLVEFSSYFPISAKASEFTIENDRSPDRGKPRYAAYVIRRNGPVKWADLGERGPIDDAIRDFRRALRDRTRADVAASARRLDSLVMAPVRVLAGASGRYLISPDGELNVVPFEAMVDEAGRYLIESHSFVYLTSGRDLLRLRSPRSPKSAPTIFADPDYGTVGATGGNPYLRFSGGPFARLRGTELEARAVRAAFADSRLITGPDATETALRRVPAPSVLHIATHGFFFEAPPPDTVSEQMNPLLRSGLAFAGANRAPAGPDDGILTALEASGLDLWGTRLVVLSACDTGVGDVVQSEGVYGLRRAFTIAGTESLVMSLWPVSDLATRELMTAYYRNLKLGLGRADSLRKVQLEMLAKPARRHPFFWAAFVHQGQWASLSGQ